ncbi:MAG TPA: oxidoreductase [Nocardioidaceae bacterium]|nr:oxidoreductase [Nocardioidaceae bacterium]
MTWTARDIPDLHGRTALVTGVTGDLGRETARGLAGAGARVILTARNDEKLRESARRISDEVPRADLDTVVLDLADLSSVRRAAESVLESSAALDILVNNAGVMATPHRRTVDGFELQLGTNHLGHFALTGLLMPALSEARVVTVSSLMHRFALHAPLHDAREERRYHKWLAYSESKLANLLFALELDRRAKAAGLGLTSVAAHPGYSATQLQTSGPQLAGKSLWSRVMAAATPVVGQKPEIGALPSLYAATRPDLPGGSYVGPSQLELRGAPKLVGMTSAARNADTAAALWQRSADATGVTFLSAVT